MHERKQPRVGGPPSTYPIQGQFIGTQSVEWSTDFSTGRNKIITGSAEQCGVHGVYVRTFKAIEDDLAFRPLVLNMMHVFFLPNLELIASYHKTL